MNDILMPHDWALGIPMGWTQPSSDRTRSITGNILYQDRIFTLDHLSYILWSDAVRGQVDFKRCGTADYTPPTLAIERQNRGLTATPSHVADAARRLIDRGLVWHFDPNDTDGYRQFEQFEIAVQGVPVGNVNGADQYRINHNDGSPALDVDAVSYLLWLQWWTDPHVLGAAKYVGRQLAIPTVDVLGRAAATLITGMSTGLLYVSGVHNG
jgi:hypothetical protein